MQPVDAYVDDLVQEISHVAMHVSGPRKMERLHLGGGTPTLLTAPQMTRLLDAVDAYFTPTSTYEFSVEIDPTEAAPEILALLAERGMRRASIGVQDFAPQVQEAIGRRQSFEQTRDVADFLRQSGVHSLNIDLLYGLPYQTQDSLRATLDLVHALSPDRLALYGYAHVPHMSKRQVMIPNDALPGAPERLESANMARDILTKDGFEAIGIDHFARPSDSLARAARSGTLARNFQGYTDDPCAVLIGFGASAISKFPQGFVQNAVATAAYQARVREGRLAGHKGYVMTGHDAVMSDIVNEIMCEGRMDAGKLALRHPAYADEISDMAEALMEAFPKALYRIGTVLMFRPGLQPLTRVVAAYADTALHANAQHIHSAAI